MILETSTDFQGIWYWEDHFHGNTFVLKIKQNIDSVWGAYCAVHDFGKRIDCSEDSEEYNIFGKIIGDTARVRFNGFFEGVVGGVAVIYKDGQHVLNWHIIKEPMVADQYYSYAPNFVKLTDKKIRR